MTQHRHCFINAAVAAPQPDDLWRHATSQADFLKIRVFGDNSQCVFAGERPNGFIICLIESDVRDVYGIREFVSESRNQFW